MSAISRERALPPVLTAFFERAVRRMATLAALRGGAAGGIIAALWVARNLVRAPVDNAALAPAIAALAPALMTVAIGAIGGGAIGWLLSRRRKHHVAHEIERRAPHSNNLLVTAQELAWKPTVARPGAADDIAGLVWHRASELTSTIDVRQLFPVAPSVALIVASMTFAGVLVAVGVTTSRGALPQNARVLAAAVTGSSEVSRVDVVVTAPTYAGQAATTLRNPSRIEALRGSSVRVTVTTNADTLVATTRSGEQRLTRQPNGQFTLSFVTAENGFVSLRTANANGTAGARKLIGISVRDDRAPRVRIVAPTRDVIVPEAHTTLDVRISADDDLAVQTLRLRYTKVSGSGERFTFSEGDVPVRIDRTSVTQWTARAQLALELLLAEPGDLVVYRAIVTDSRPGSAPVESDALIAELASPGGVAALGFSVDPDEDRYGLSQQMVILKTERLLAQKAKMTAAAVSEEAMQLASEQRRVRAEFVFMMGGEFAQEISADNSMDDLDETHEAESESDLSAGRMANRGRSALLAAVRAMSRASSALTSGDVTSALTSEKVALKQLQEAFARSRFLMRALSQREQIDYSRRLSGRLDSIARVRASIPDGDRIASTAMIRSVLAELLSASAASTDDREFYVGLAEQVLQIDASSPAAQRVAGQLTEAGNTSTGQSLQLQAARDSAAVGLTRMLRERVRPAPNAPAPPELRQLQNELEAALKRGAVAGPPRVMRK